jgi:hypothetical protein
MHLRQFSRQFILFILLFGSGLSSQLLHAGMIELSVFGETRTATQGNDFGLSVGDMVGLKAVFNSSSFNGIGHEVIGLSNKDTRLSLSLGDTTFDLENHLGIGLGFTLGYPKIHLYDGSFSGLDYAGVSTLYTTPGHSFFSTTSSCCGFDNWLGFDSRMGVISGGWIENSQTIEKVADIPEPAPLVLAGLGLLGAWISARRKKKVFKF